MKLYQITEEDLAELERILPDAMERLTHRPDVIPADRVNFRQVQKIIVNVRWNYGPHDNVERIDAGAEE